MNGNNKIFAQLVESVLSMVLYVSGQNVFFDAYRQPSIKYSERLNRGASTSDYSFRIFDGANKHNPSSTNPWQGNTTYSSGGNSCAVLSPRRASSICWLASGNYSDADICCKALHATCEETCFKMTADEWVKVVELQCTQEESRHPFVVACTACCKNWLEGSHSRIHRCHVTLSCFPKGYPLSHQLEVRDTEPHTVCRHQQTGMVIGRQHM